MAFELEVTFTGLCLHAVQEDGQAVAVLLPDCRYDIAGGVHADGTVGTPHVGYLKFDLAHLLPQAAPPMAGLSEVVHRFNYEALHFGLPPGGVDARTGLPAFEEIAPHPDNSDVWPPIGTPLPPPEIQNPNRAQVRLVPGVFGDNPPPVLLMRTVLHGGTLHGHVEGGWAFTNAFDRTRVPYTGTFAQRVVWRVTVDAAHLDLTLGGFDGSNERTVRLLPLDGMIALKISNLCSDNPLEWDWFAERESPDEDPDFRWLYRLLEQVPGLGYPDAFKRDLLPIPRIDGPGGQGTEGCIGGTLKVGSIGV